jgi:hypothetical protein
MRRRSCTRRARRRALEGRHAGSLSASHLLRERVAHIIPAANLNLAPWLAFGASERSY